MKYGGQIYCRITLRKRQNEPRGFVDVNKQLTWYIKGIEQYVFYYKTTD